MSLLTSVIRKVCACFPGSVLRPVTPFRGIRAIRGANWSEFQIRLFPDTGDVLNLPKNVTKSVTRVRGLVSQFATLDSQIRHQCMGIGPNQTSNWTSICLRKPFYFVEVNGWSIGSERASSTSCIL